jgi:hypothetical protein
MPSGQLDGFTPVALRSSEFKLESGINGAPYGLSMSNISPRRKTRMGLAAQ